eukprot:2393468-Alexandrium_andersonii.AAC.1
MGQDALSRAWNRRMSRILVAQMRVAERRFALALRGGSGFRRFQAAERAGGSANFRPGLRG